MQGRAIGCRDTDGHKKLLLRRRQFRIRSCELYKLSLNVCCRLDHISCQLLAIKGLADWREPTF